MRIKHHELIDCKLTVLIEGETSDYSVAINVLDVIPVFASVKGLHRFFTMTPDIGYCTCPDYLINEKVCKHMRFVLDNMLNLLEGEHDI